MGCVACSEKRLPETPQGIKHQDADTGGIDDLGWIPKGGPSIPLDKGESIRGSKRPFEGVRVQIELPGGWADCSPEETRQICELKARGETVFTLNARGQHYTIDMLDRDGASQLNVSTGKKRKLRIVDSDRDTGDDIAPPSRGDSDAVVAVAPEVAPEVARQREWGPQSKRGGASQHPFRVLEDNTHARDCFLQFETNEARLCGEWSVFYHSYSYAALIYEVQAAVGSVLFRFRSKFGALPRILVNEFNEIADAKELARRFKDEFAQHKRDHHPSFRRVALSAMCSLASTGPEACTAMVFISGYSCKDLNFRSVIENLLESCYVPKPKVKKLADDILALSEKHGLDVSQYGGKACKSGKGGHLMQIFIKRNLVDKLVYAAKPYGVVDEDRMPISEWMDSDKSFSLGQARIVAHPKYFMQANSVRTFVGSADPTFHHNREAFQQELVKLLGMILGDTALREKAATGIYGGTLPPWWTPRDQREFM